ncbi:hypothetical protein D3C86_1941730 [compost metagenome]
MESVPITLDGQTIIVSSFYDHVEPECPTLHLRDDAVSLLNQSAENLLLESRLAQLDEAILIDLLLS